MQLVRYSSEYDDEIVRLFHETVHTACSGQYTPNELEAWAPGDIDPAVWCEGLRNTYMLLAFDGDILAGFGNVDIPASYIDRLYVAVPYIGKGVGKLLLTSLESKLDDIAYVHSSDTALPFFKGRGYSLIKENHEERRGVIIRNWYMYRNLK